jgi:uncharacterized protein YfbU (UPF0304 family)
MQGVLFFLKKKKKKKIVESTEKEREFLDLVRLITDREERYTTLQQVKDHPWFEGLDWTKLREMVSLAHSSF